MIQNLLAIAALSVLLLGGPAMAATPSEIDGTTHTITVPASTTEDADENTDITVTSTGGTDGELRLASSGAGAAWKAKSLTLTSGGTTTSGIFELDGTNEITVSLSGALTIGGNDDVGAAMRVTGTEAVLNAAGGVRITGLGRLVLDTGTSAELDASSTSFTINTTGTTSAIDMGANTKLSVNALNFQAGTLILGATGSEFTAEGNVVVGGYLPPGEDDYEFATLVIDGSGTVTFKTALTVGEGGTITSGTSAGAITLGSGRTLTLAGGTLSGGAGGALTINADRISVNGTGVSTIDTTLNNVIFNQSSGAASTFNAGVALTVASDLDILGGNTLEFHSYAQTGGTVTTVDSGGRIHVLDNSDTAKISGGTFAASARFDGGAAFSGSSTLLGTGQTITVGSGMDFTFGSNTTIDLADAALTISGADDMQIAGAVRIGGTAAAANTLTSDGKVTFYAGSDIKLTADFAREVIAAASANAGNTLIASGGAGMLETGIPGGQLTSDNFLLGLFTLTDDGQYLYVSEADRRGLLLDGSADDFARAETLIRDRYGRWFSGGFAENIYKSVVDDAAPAPYDKLLPDAGISIGSGSNLENSYDMNLANLTGFATGDRRADASLAALYTGLNNSGVVDVAMATAEAVTTRTRDHLRHIGETRTALRETVGSDCALAAGILNSDFENRIRVGGFGMWEDANEYGDLGGYRYESAGFIGGYDYACGPFSVGGTLAYTTGNFMDKTALAHDSKIHSYSASLHGAFYGPEGFFAMATGGYTLSRNRINELRSNPSVNGASWNEANYDTNTWTAAIEAGFDIRPAPCLNITPSVGFTYIDARVQDHHERLGGVVAGRITGVDSYAAYLPVRLEVGYEMITGDESRLKLTGRGGYAYNFNNNGIGGDFDMHGFSNAFTHTVVGRKPERHHYTGGAGLRFVTDQFDVGVDYDYSARSSYSAHRVTATAGFRF